jgi:hypothetical protein
MNTPTPRTDAATYPADCLGTTLVTNRDCARALERELTALAAELTVALAQWNGALERAMKAEADLAALGQCHDDNCRAVVKFAADLTAERERVRILREALENLRDEQNGAPLCTREEEWKQAMDTADAALAATEGAK